MVQLTLFNSNQSSPFDAIKRVDEYNNEYWSARELMELLEYTKWSNFKEVIRKTVVALETAGYRPTDHIAETSNMIQVGKGAQRKIEDFKLSRLACYHAAQEADASKPSVAAAKNYFTIQTRKQEVSEQQKLLKNKQDTTAYQLKGKSQEWAETRVDSKRSQAALGAALVDTHKENAPDFYAVNATINTELFDKTKAEIIDYLGLLPKDSKNYRDHLGEYALDALRQVNRTAAKRMNSLRRELSAQEQLDIIKQVVRIVAPTMKELAQYANQDFISGAELDEHGNALINRHVRLLPKGDK